VKHAVENTKRQKTSAVCFTDLDQGIKMIIFQSMLTTFTASVVFRGSWGSIEMWLELKIEPPLANLACLNQ
jgi:hypothetical protein